jgi:CheY-like chemotaxis protein
MVFGVVRQSGGTVRIRSRLREGTSVQIYLPRTAEPAAFGSLGLQTAERAHILVVDDDPDVRWITAEDLREIGYVVTEAEDGRAALAILERDDPCDLMVVDLVMTGLTGVDTVRLAARSTRPQGAVLQRLCGHVQVRGRHRQRIITQETVQTGYLGRGGWRRSSACLPDGCQ